MVVSSVGLTRPHVIHVAVSGTSLGFSFTARPLGTQWIQEVNPFPFDSSLAVASKEESLELGCRWEKILSSVALVLGLADLLQTAADLPHLNSVMKFSDSRVRHKTSHARSHAGIEAAGAVSCTDLYIIVLEASAFLNDVRAQVGDGSFGHPISAA